jgi:hypothetical protein
MVLRAAHPDLTSHKIAFQTAEKHHILLKIYAYQADIMARFTVLPY